MNMVVSVKDILNKSLHYYMMPINISAMICIGFPVSFSILSLFKINLLIPKLKHDIIIKQRNAN